VGSIIVALNIPWQLHPMELISYKQVEV